MGEIKEHQSHLQLIYHDYNYKVYSLTKQIVDKQNYLIKGMLFMYLHQMLTSHETLTSSTVYLSPFHSANKDQVTTGNYG